MVSFRFNPGNLMLFGRVAYRHYLWRDRQRRFILASTSRPRSLECWTLTDVAYRYVKKRLPVVRPGDSPMSCEQGPVYGWDIIEWQEQVVQLVMDVGA